MNLIRFTLLDTWIVAKTRTIQKVFINQNLNTCKWEKSLLALCKGACKVPKFITINYNIANSQFTH
jgi:hypothetical protein